MRKRVSPGVNKLEKDRGLEFNECNERGSGEDSFAAR